MAQSVIEGKYNSKSPIRPSQGTTWGVINNMHKSALIESNPSKLQQMKQKVQRDRSANAENERESSLYGRKNTGDIDQEFQKLRQSYNDHRKPHNRSQSRTQLGTLQKQKFIEDPFDDNKSSSNIAQILKSQNEQLTQSNRFKRTSQKSNKTLANYQHKYQKLEQNFKKFSSNLVNPSQSDQIIKDLKQKAGFSFIFKIIKKSDLNDLQRAIKIWKLNSGLSAKMFQTQGKTLILARCSQKLIKNNYKLKFIQAFTLWKELIFKNKCTDKIVSILSSIITSSDYFNRCVQNDCYLSEIFSQKLESIINIVSSDIVFYTDDSQTMKVYHHLSGKQINLSEQIKNSLLGSVLANSDSIQSIQYLQKDNEYCRDIDMPINYESISDHIKYLSCIFIKLDIGVLRLFFQQKGNMFPSSYQSTQVKHIGAILPSFISRILDVRSQINSLALQNISQNEQISELNFYNQMNAQLNSYNNTIMCNNSYADLIETTKEQVNNFLSESMFINANLIQIVQSIHNVPQLLLETNKNEIVKIKDHQLQKKEIIFDVLDHRKEFLIHQISICPKSNQNEFSNYTFILHIKYEHNQSLNPYKLDQTDSTLFATDLVNNEDKLDMDEQTQDKVCLFFKSLAPIFNQTLMVVKQFIPKMNQMEETIQQEQIRYNFQKQMELTSINENLLEEKELNKFYLKLKMITLNCIQEMGYKVTENEPVTFFINQQLVADLSNTKLAMFAILDHDQLNYFQNHIANKFDDIRSENKYEIKEANQIYVNSKVFSMDIIKEHCRVTIPICNQKTFAISMVMILHLQSNEMLNVDLLQEEMTSFLTSLTLKRNIVMQMKQKYQSVYHILKDEQMNQHTKNLLQEHLVIPFLMKQSYKSLGDGIDSLCENCVSNCGPNMDQMGQEISQIALIQKQLFIEDIRLLHTYSQSNSAVIDKMLLQCYQQNQQLIYEDETMDRVILLYPISASNKIRCGQNTSIILRIGIERDHQIQAKMNNILKQLIHVITPIVSAILTHDVITPKQTLAIEKINKIVDKYKFSCYRDMIYFMRDLKAKNVYNFSRTRIFDKLKKSSKFHAISEDTLWDHDKKQFEQNQVIQQLIRQSVVIMNKYAFAYKKNCFNKFVIGTRAPLYKTMSKKKKKAISALAQYYQLVVMRELFTRFAINTKTFKFINHPKTRYLGSINCIFRNFRVVRERLAFIKLKKNLNMQLRNAMNSYKDNDKELFVQLNQILISSQNQQGGLEGGFSYALSEIFLYLQNQIEQQAQIKDIGQVAGDTFVGHFDEAVFTIKSGVYIPNQQITDINQKVKIMISGTNCSNMRTSQDKYFDQNKSQQNDASDIIPNNEFENNLQQKYTKHHIGLKKDLIHSMLAKSNGITFNFQNIQQSLSEMLLKQQSKHLDQNIGNRYSIVKKSKSSLIIPLFDVSQQIIIGSFELYKHHQQSFTEEIEERYEYFAKLVSDFFLLYGQLQQQSLSIGQLKWQIKKQIRPVQSLSALLKNIYVNGPETYFLNSTHVLPIIILSQEYKGMGDLNSIDDSFVALEHKIINEHKKAFFYQFKDNHIYNFDYEGTFIEEILDNGCILEMCRQGHMNADENIKPELGDTIHSQQSSIDNIFHHQFDILSSNRGNLTDQNQLSSKRFGGHRHTTVQQESENVKTVTNELFKHIIYYPVFDQSDSQQIIALIEVGYKTKLSPTDTLLTDDIQQYLDQFRSQLQQFKLRLSSFSRNLENICVKNNQKKMIRMFQEWKQMMIFTQYKEQFQANQFNALQNQEMCYQEYIQNLDKYNNQIKNVNDDKMMLQKQITQYSIEKKAKLKFLATSLISSSNLFKKLQRHRTKEAFLKWQYNVSIRKIAETAFSRVLELNHKHSRARFKTGVFLLQNIVEEYSIQQSFNSILQAAHMRKFEAIGAVSSLDKRSRSRTKGHNESSFILNNITSLLSPSNLKQIEKTNLYTHQINSLYAPQGSTSQNTSAILNPLTQSRHKDINIPQIQLQPHQITKEVFDRSNSRERQSQSTYAVTQNIRNPYTEMNLSQIENTNDKKDYSPIVTNSRYDAKSIYNPQVISSRNRKDGEQNKRNRSMVTRQSQSSKLVGQRKQSVQLEKELIIKKQQLLSLKHQLKKVRSNSNVDATYRTQQEKKSLDSTANLSLLNLNLKENDHSKLMKHATSISSNCNSQPKFTKSSLAKKKQNHNSSYNQIALFSCESELSMLKNQDKKYEQINGKDVSPPVRDSYSKRLSSRDQKKKAADQIQNILHTKYQQMEK